MPAAQDAALLRLINDCQRCFPLQSRPFAALAETMPPGWDEDGLLAALGRAREAGLLSRIGAVFAPNTVGSSTLAAMAVPEAQLDSVASFVSSHRQVNHNYRRDHRYNLWFVVAADSPAGVADVLSRIYLATGIRPLNLPLVREYHIDLGFDFLPGGHLPARVAVAAPLPVELADWQRQRLLAALSGGLPLTERPYAALADSCGLDEAQALGQIARWQSERVIRRFGMVVRHHELGYRANAMCVWRIDDIVERDRVARLLSAEPAVTLCYERPARAPDWPYQLFTMIHARDAQALDAALDDIRRRHGLHDVPLAVLRSTRRYKQSGARYGHA
ncbi:Lrp/AsnC family transcriptional regulator [uncultured Aquitalea sp.]|uniref:siroheme decarboxylase subunit beta n=1 Tax=uncultured Aquitalea sp. TaxID=540272 RepID=UPI0025E476DF|nr:Lrp/AsnC family transcriptional regulator [uncultured Aquitalea sp.]